VYSSDVDVRTYVAERPEDDGVWITLMVGPSDELSEESFDVLVCTPLWLSRTVREEGPQIGRHRLIVDPMDLQAAIEFLRARFEAFEAPTWDLLGEKLSRLGYWEFEDYQPYKEPLQ
jgi:hypothetical protein